MYIPEDVIYSERGYIAPTVYAITHNYVPRWNYYSTLDAAKAKYAYLNNAGGYDAIPAGEVTFVNNGTNQTMGYNCDFYILKDGEWQLTSYKYLKTQNAIYPPVIYRFIRTDGAGSYYAIFDWRTFGMSAYGVDSVSPEKLQALDDFYRSIQTVKYRYNTLVGFLNNLSSKQLNSVEQQIFNQGMLLLNSFNQQLTTIRSIEIQYTSDGAIGILPVILIIAIIAILSAATAWTITSIVSEKQKTQRIIDSYDFTQWVTAKKQEVAAQVTAGTISKDAAASIYKNLDDAAKVANTVANNSATATKPLLEQVGTIVKWGVAGVILFELLKTVQLKKNAS